MTDLGLGYVKYVVEAICPDCLGFGEIVDLEVDFIDGYEIYFFCPTCYNQYSLAELKEMGAL